MTIAQADKAISKKGLTGLTFLGKIQAAEYGILLI
jgi:hypothetical protein